MVASAAIIRRHARHEVIRLIGLAFACPLRIIDAGPRFKTRERQIVSVSNARAAEAPAAG